jgi:hypothetical protein
MCHKVSVSQRRNNANAVARTASVCGSDASGLLLVVGVLTYRSG